jgi:hypothetical protein
VFIGQSVGAFKNSSFQERKNHAPSRVQKEKFRENIAGNKVAKYKICYLYKP